MTENEKQLLLTDLCARLPYGIKFPYHMNGDNSHKECDCIATVDGISDDIVEFTYEEDGVTRDWSCPISEVKPYLRPLTRWYMTADERIYLLEELGFDADLENGELNDFGSYVYRRVNVLPLFDWLNEHHFDYRGLIPMGLALEAPEGMYKTE